MTRNQFLTIFIFSLICGAFSKEQSSNEAAEHREQTHTDTKLSEVTQSHQRHSVKLPYNKQQVQVQNSNAQYAEAQQEVQHPQQVVQHPQQEVQLSQQAAQHPHQEVQHPQQEVQHPQKEAQPSQQEVQHSQQEVHESQHSDKQQPEIQRSETVISKKQIPSTRQFYPPQYHQPMLFQPPSGFEAIRRQFGGGFGSDLVMMGLISLPIIGLLTMGSASLGSLFGLGSASSSKKSTSKRTRRSLKEKAADAVEYAKNLWNVMEQLERAFEKYDLYQAECRLRVVCEAHHKDRRMGSWGQNILDLMRQQKELEGRELLPVSRFLFSNYAEAAQAGVRNEDCSQLYTGCPRHLSYYLSSKEDELENEVENGM